MRTQAGSIPDDGIAVAQLGSGQFTLYECFDGRRDRRSRGRWKRYKLIATTWRIGKANWQLAWNGERFAHGRDSQLLEQHLPDLHAELLAWLRLPWPAKVAVSFATAEERAAIQEAGG